MLAVTYSTGTTRPSDTLPAFSHVFTILMENKEYPQIIGSSGAPYMNSLASPVRPGDANYTGISASEPAELHGAHRRRNGFHERLRQGCTTAGFQHSSMKWSIRASLEGLYGIDACAMRHHGYLGPVRAEAQPVRPLRRMSVKQHDHGAEITLCRSPQFATDLKSRSARRLCLDLRRISATTCTIVQSRPAINGCRAWCPQIIGAPAFKNSVLFILWDEGTTTTAAAGGTSDCGIQFRPKVPVGWNADHDDLLRTIEDDKRAARQIGTATAMKEFFAGR